jgi:hypothetical protein
MTLVSESKVASSTSTSSTAMSRSTLTVPSKTSLLQTVFLVWGVFTKRLDSTKGWKRFYRMSKGSFLELLELARLERNENQGWARSKYCTLGAFQAVESVFFSKTSCCCLVFGSYIFSGNFFLARPWLRGQLSYPLWER